MAQVVQLFGNPLAGSYSAERVRGLVRALEAAGARVIRSDSSAGVPVIAEEATHVCIAAGDGGGRDPRSAGRSPRPWTSPRGRPRGHRRRRRSRSRRRRRATRSSPARTGRPRPRAPRPKASAPSTAHRRCGTCRGSRACPAATGRWTNAARSRSSSSHERLRPPAGPARSRRARSHRSPNTQDTCVRRARTGHKEGRARDDCCWVPTCPT